MYIYIYIYIYISPSAPAPHGPSRTGARPDASDRPVFYVHNLSLSLSIYIYIYSYIYIYTHIYIYIRISLYICVYIYIYIYINTSDSDLAMCFLLEIPMRGFPSQTKLSEKHRTPKGSTNYKVYYTIYYTIIEHDNKYTLLKCNVYTKNTTIIM